MKYVAAKKTQMVGPRPSPGGGSIRRFTMGAALVVAIVLMLGAVAAATPPECRPKDPACSGTTTTAPAEPASVPTCTTSEDGLLLDEDGSAYLPRSGLNRLECLWTPEEKDTESGTVTVRPTSGAISGVVVFVRDASPGDICVLEQDWDAQTGPPYTASFALVYGDLPDDVNPDFGPFENQTYWKWDAGHWCYPQDGAMRDDPNGKPLHLKLSFRATKGTEVEIVLSPAQDTSPANP